MNILVAPLLAVLIGLFVRSRLVGVVLYLAVEGLFFTFQTLVVLLAWMSGQGGFGGATEEGAFGPAPTGLPLTFSEGDVFAYGLVNLLLIAIGVGVTGVIATLRRRQRSRRAGIQVA